MDFRHFGAALGFYLGCPTGIMLALALALLGHGWWSLLAIPVTPAVLCFMGSALDGM